MACCLHMARSQLMTILQHPAHTLKPTAQACPDLQGRPVTLLYSMVHQQLCHSCMRDTADATFIVFEIESLEAAAEVCRAAFLPQSPLQGAAIPEQAPSGG